MLILFSCWQRWMEDFQFRATSSDKIFSELSINNKRVAENCVALNIYEHVSFSPPRHETSKTIGKNIVVRCWLFSFASFQSRERKFCVVEANVRQAINRARAIALFFMNENSFFSWFYACGLMFVVVSAARVRLINCVVGRVRRGTEEDIAVSTNLLAARVFCWFFGGRKVSAFLFASAAIRILPMSLRLVEKVNNKQ